MRRHSRSIDWLYWFYATWVNAWEVISAVSMTVIDNNDVFFQLVSLFFFWRCQFIDYLHFPIRHCTSITDSRGQVAAINYCSAVYRSALITFAVTPWERFLTPGEKVFIDIEIYQCCGNIIFNDSVRTAFNLASELCHNLFYSSNYISNREIVK